MNYYNENDPYAAAWLRRLIALRVIPPGVVDERSILDVNANDLLGFRQCHFFAGIGGWAEALALAGVDPDEPLWTASCPCQPFSGAGLGEVDKDERHLWPAFRGLVSICRPTICFGEQVASNDGRIWLAGVRADMEALGYGVGGADLCAAGVAAPHIRQRLYWVAAALSQGLGDANGAGQQTRYLESIAASPRPERLEQSGSPCGLADDGSERRERRPGVQGDRGEASQRSEAIRDAGDRSEPDRLADPDRVGPDRAVRTRDGRQGFEDDGSTGGMANLFEPGLQGLAGHGDNRDEPGRDDAHPVGPTPASGEPRWLGDPYGARERGGDERQAGTARDEVGQPGDGPRAANESGDRREDARHPALPLPGGFWDEFDLIACRDGKVRRIEPGSFPLAHGVSGRVAIRRPGEQPDAPTQENWYNRTGALKGFGNAIVPPLAAVFIRACRDALAYDL